MVTVKSVMVQINLPNGESAGRAPTPEESALAREPPEGVFGGQSVSLEGREF